MISLALTASTCLFAQTENNPFAKYGYDKQIMYTSSKGEFEEFHDQTDVVEIGTALFDTRTNQFVGFVSDEQEKNEIAAAISAMAPDPLCEKYYWISPYAYCLNNPIKYIDPDGRRVVAASIDAQRMILNTLPKEYRQYVSFNIGGVMNTAGLANVKSTSGNFDALRTMALSDRTMDVRLDDKFDYLDSKGNKDTRTMGWGGIDDFYIGNFGGKGIDASTGETGFLGKTLFPDLNGVENSTNRNIIVIVHSKLSEKGRAELYSHEANGHAYVYMITNGNRKKASHNFLGSDDLNDDLYKLINRSMNETVKNMDDDDNGKDVWMILNQFLMQNPNIKVFQ